LAILIVRRDRLLTPYHHLLPYAINYNGLDRVDFERAPR
jgi:hypothetical protein